MKPYHPLRIADTELWLLADKAVYWPEEETLLIADAHFGKAAAYRKLGQPVPQGTTQANLRRLDALLQRHPCKRLIFLGDFLHAPQSHAATTLGALHEWRGKHASLTITLIRGNHDRRAGDPPASLCIDVAAEPSLLGPFALQHEPQPHSNRLVLAGHLHPTFQLSGRGRQSLRLPCFCVDAAMMLLPAFGAFTGGMNIARVAGRRIFVVGDEGVWPV
jgi:DNA ligase-associated metallophosphoesterase